MKKMVYVYSLFLMLTGCAIGSAGKDSKGQGYQAQANVVVAALIQYKAKKGIYPKFYG